MSELRFPATVDGLGRLKFDAPELRQAELSRLAGKRVVEIVKREVLTRSIAQNRLLWGTYGEAVAWAPDLRELATGEPVFKTPEDVHGWAKLQFLRRPVMTTKGEMDLLGTTTTLSTAEFSLYVEMMVAKLAEYGVFVPPMGESVGR